MIARRLLSIGKYSLNLASAFLSIIGVFDLGLPVKLTDMTWLI